jgi:hypothetical protein
MNDDPHSSISSATFSDGIELTAAANQALKLLKTANTEINAPSMPSVRLQTRPQVLRPKKDESSILSR